MCNHPFGCRKTPDFGNMANRFRPIDAGADGVSGQSVYSPDRSTLSNSSTPHSFVTAPDTKEEGLQLADGVEQELEPPRPQESHDQWLSESFESIWNTWGARKDSSSSLSLDRPRVGSIDTSLGTFDWDALNANADQDKDSILTHYFPTKSQKSPSSVAECFSPIGKEAPKSFPSIFGDEPALKDASTFQASMVPSSVAFLSNVNNSLLTG